MKHTYVSDGDEYYLVCEKTSDGYLIPHSDDSNIKMLIRFNKVCDIIDVVLPYCSTRIRFRMCS